MLHNCVYKLGHHHFSCELSKYTIQKRPCHNLRVGYGRVVGDKGKEQLLGRDGSGGATIR